MSLLSVRDLQVWFDLPHGGRLHAVQGVRFDLQEGERLGLVGESGCGKTTALLALMGLLPPNAEVAGSVAINGTDILAGGEDSMRPYRWTDVAMIFQGAMNALNPVRTIGAQIVEPMEFHGTASGAAAKKQAGELLELVGHPGVRRPRGTRTSSPAACGSARRSRWRWPAARRCCSPTSPRPRWT